MTNRNTPIHNSWCNMKARCDNPNRSTWKNYGEHEIKTLYKSKSFTQAKLAKLYSITQAGISAVLKRVG